VGHLRIRRWLILTAALFAVPSVGCSTPQYGKLSLVRDSRAGVPIQQLYERWKEYHVLYAGPSLENPSGILFDPKGDGKALKTDRWIAVHRQEDLAELIRGIGMKPNLYPKLYEIMSPDRQVYGYLYTSWDHVYIKRIDEKTLWVESLALPPMRIGP